MLNRGVKVENEWSHTYSPSYAFMACTRRVYLNIFQYYPPIDGILSFCVCVYVQSKVYRSVSFSSYSFISHVTPSLLPLVNHSLIIWLRVSFVEILIMRFPFICPLLVPDIFFRELFSATASFALPPKIYGEFNRGGYFLATKQKMQRSWNVEMLLPDNGSMSVR